MSLRLRKIFLPSGKLDKECVLPFKVNFTANCKAHLYLMSSCDRTVRSGLSDLCFWIVEGERSANTCTWWP